VTLTLRQLLGAVQARRKPKIAKGARDIMPEQMIIRQRALATITAVFERHGACTIDTPVFELKDTLTGKCVTPPTPNLSTAFRY
jgi:histidyl-tRNA synthetase